MQWSIGVSEATEETEYQVLRQLSKNLATFLMVELFAAMNAGVHSAAGSAKRVVFWIIVVECLTDAFPDGYDPVGEDVRDRFYQFSEFVWPQFVLSGTLDLILALNLDKWWSFDVFMDRVAQKLANKV